MKKNLLPRMYLTFVICFSFQMVWEQGVVVIVNLTKLSDLGLVSIIHNIRNEIEKKVSIARYM